MNLNKYLMIVMCIILFSALLLTAGDKNTSQHPEVDYSVSCKECHSEISPEVFKNWKESKHGIMNYSCYLCHGDGQETFYSKPGTERCIGCHPVQEVDFSKIQLNNCFDCHQGHTLKFHK